MCMKGRSHVISVIVRSHVISKIVRSHVIYVAHMRIKVILSHENFVPVCLNFYVALMDNTSSYATKLFFADSPAQRQVAAHHRGRASDAFGVRHRPAVCCLQPSRQDAATRVFAALRRTLAEG